MKFEPRKYQLNAITWLVQRTIIDRQSGSGFFIDPGLGKTPMSLSWLRALDMFASGEKTLVVAPLRVVYSVWPKEIDKWEQFQHIESSIIHGPASKRLAALSKPSNIYLINPAGLPWLREVQDRRLLPFKNLIVDESSAFKSWGNVSTKALRKLAPKFDRRLIMTGTPCPNNLQDIFSQVYLMDLGESLGTSISKFRTKYFYRGGFGGYSWIPKPGAKEEIESKISHMILRLSEEDHLSLPDKIINDVWVDLPSAAMHKYKKLEREMFLELGPSISQGIELTPVNAGSKYQMCKQVANGGVYDQEKRSHHIHNAKIEALVDIVNELQGKPVLIAFQYHHDLDRIRKVYPKIPSIDGTKRGTAGAKEVDALIDQWNAGALHLLAVQPQALSHGVNMQSGPGRDVVWFGLTDNLDAYLQFNKRIHRQGVDGVVRIHRILASRTVDVLMADRTETKDLNQRSFLDALNRYRSTAR